MIYVIQQMWARRGTTLRLAGTIALFVWLVTVVQGLAGAFLQALEAPFRSAGVHLTVQRAGPPPARFEGLMLPSSHGAIQAEEVARISALRQVKSVTGALYLWQIQGSALTAVLAVDRLGDRPLPPGAVLLTERAAARIGLQAGSTMELSGHRLRLEAVLPDGAIPLPDVDVVVALADARKWLAAASLPADWQPEAVNLLLVEAAPGQSAALLQAIPPLLGDLRQREADGDVAPDAEQGAGGRQVTLRSAGTLRQQAGGLFGLMSRFAFMVSVLAGLAGAAVVLKLFATDLAGRRQEMGIMRALGWTMREVHRRFIGYAALIALFGSLLGTSGARLTLTLGSRLSVRLPADPTAPLPPGISRAGGGELATVALQPVLSPGLAGASILLPVLIGVLAALILAARLRKIKPTEVLQYE